MLRFCLIIPALTICLSNVYAQTWFDTNNRWIYSYSEWSVEGYQILEVQGDTLINNQACKVLSQERVYKNWLFGSNDTISFQASAFFFYEEEDQVFYFNGEQFQVIYDFNLQAGDSLALDLKHPDFRFDCKDPITFYIDSVSQIQFGDRIRRVQFARVRFPDFFSDWQMVRIVEGLGIVEETREYQGQLQTRNFGHLIPAYLYPCATDLAEFTPRCFESPGVNLQFTNEDCYALPTITSTKEVGSQELEISPNPVQDFFWIKNISGLKSPEYYLFDLSGKMIKQGQISSNRVDVQTLEIGVYLLKIRLSKSWVTRKIVKANY